MLARQKGVCNHEHGPFFAGIACLRQGVVGPELNHLSVMREALGSCALDGFAEALEHAKGQAE